MESDGGYRKAFDKVCSTFLKDAVRTHVLCSGKEGSENEFLEAVYNPMVTNTKLDPVAIARLYQSMEREERTYTETLRLACAYQIAAIQAFDGGKGGRAWSFLCRAEYWLGRTHQKLVTPVMLKRITLKRASKGGAERYKNKGYGPVKEFALGLVAGKEHTFRTKNHAATELKQEVLDFAKKNKIVMFETQMVGNLNRWFTGITFGSKS